MYLPTSFSFIFKMNCVPVEVLSQIFTKLDFKDKLECMLVCRSWYNTLDQYTLLCRFSVKSYRKFKDMLTLFPHRATQVEYLTVYHYFKPYLDKGELFNMFPNLREISFNTDSRLRVPPFYTAKPFQFLHAICKLEKIKDFGYELVSQLAMSNLCINLKSIDLNFRKSRKFREFEDFITANNVVSQLKNMPVLKELSMAGIGFKLMDLEIMHINLPSLKRLCLKSAHQISGEIPRDVVPASLITELEVKIEEAEDRDTRIQFYKYIGNKYPSLKKPIFDAYFYLLDHGEDIIPYIYNEGIFPLCQKIGSQVDTFLFSHYYDGSDAFRKFDDYGMKLKELTIEMSWRDEDDPFIEELVRSQQSKYIQKLSLWDIIPDPIRMINHLEVLDTLNISSRCSSTPYAFRRRKMKNRIDLTQLINACPATLTTLSTAHVYLTFGEPASTITNIKHLKLIDVDFTPMLTSIIETSFPKLSTLALSGDIDFNITILLPKHNLKEVSITALYNKRNERNEYTVESKCDDGVECHTIKRIPDYNNRGSAGVYNTITNTFVKIEYNKPLTLKFICLSVKQTFLFIEKKFG
jgi:hypothetical protein